MTTVSLTNGAGIKEWLEASKNLQIFVNGLDSHLTTEGLSSNPNEREHPFTKSDFEQALNKVTRKIKK